MGVFKLRWEPMVVSSHPASRLENIGSQGCSPTSSLSTIGKAHGSAAAHRLECQKVPLHSQVDCWSHKPKDVRSESHLILWHFQVDPNLIEMLAFKHRFLFNLHLLLGAQCYLMFIWNRQRSEVKVMSRDGHHMIANDGIVYSSSWWVMLMVNHSIKRSALINNPQFTFNTSSLWFGLIPTVSSNHPWHTTPQASKVHGWVPVSNSGQRQGSTWNHSE